MLTATQAATHRTMSPRMMTTARPMTFEYFEWRAGKNNAELRLLLDCISFTYMTIEAFDLGSMIAHDMITRMTRQSLQVQINRKGGGIP
jgi:hypothetical protein